MINRKLIAALVGLSLASGVPGMASAQNAAPVPAASASPADAAAPATATRTDGTVGATTKAKAKTTSDAHRASHVSPKAHRKHVAHRAPTRRVATVTTAHGGATRVSHAVKRTATKHV